MLRVGLDLTHTAARRPTGTSVYARALAEGLVRRGEVEVVPCYRWSAWPRHLRGAPKLPHPRYYWDRWAPSLSRALDVFHGTESRAGRFGPRKQVVTLHEVMHLWLPGFVDGPGAAWRREAYATLVAAADRVITVSAFEREKILEHLKLPPDRVVAVPLAAGPSFAPPEPGAGAAVRRRLGLEGPYVLSVGLAQPRKNTVRLVQAFAQVQTEAVLVLAGSTHAAYEAELAAACAPLGARVRRLGYVGPDDLPALYAGAWATAVPSLYESFGIPVLEAMACGSPVACASSGSLPEVAGDAALQFDPLDLDAISSALTKLCGDEALRARLAAAGRARAATFSVDRTARETTAVYTSL